MHIGTNLRRVRCRRTSVVCSKYGGGFRGSTATPRKFCNFYSHLCLEKVLPSLKGTQCCYILYEKFFLKTVSFIIIGSNSLSLTNIRYWKGYSHNLTKYEIFSQFRKILKYSLGLYSINPVFHLFPECFSSLREKRPNTELFMVRIFLYSN